MTKVHVLRTGYTLVSPAVPDRSCRKSSFAYTGLSEKRNERIKVPVKCFLLEINGRKVLVDTGWGKACIAHPIFSIGFGLWFASEPVLSKEETLGSWFAQLHIRPCDLDAVVLTHMDVDHISGLMDVADAQHIYTTKDEWKHAQTCDVRYNRRLWKGLPIEFLSMSADAHAPFCKSCDLFGDGSIRVVFTPGHSAGSVAVVVYSGERFAVIAGDDGYNADSWDKLLLPGPMYNADDMLRSLQWVREMREAENCVGVFAAHDPAVAPGEYTV